VDHSYAAGIIDGEGCLSITWHRTRNNYSIAATVGMADKGSPVLHALARRYGGRVRSRSKANDVCRAQIVWRLTGQRAAAFLRLIRPYLLLKTAEGVVVEHRLDAVLSYHFPASAVVEVATT
jgi:hypothetical protein